MLFFSIVATEETGQGASVPAAVKVNDELIIKIASGDKQAFTDLYNAAGSAVFGFALSILQNRHNAEDVLQDTFIKVWQAAPVYQPMGKPLAWILTIAKNLSRMKLREAEGKNLALEEGQPPRGEANFTDNKLDEIVLNTALEKLGSEERQIIILHSLTGMKHREIALLMDLPISTVLSKYRRGLAKLKKHLKEDIGLPANS